MAELGTTKNKNDSISDLIDWHSKNDQLKHLFAGISKLRDFVF